jgi:hypothetical protein
MMPLTLTSSPSSKWTKQPTCVFRTVCRRRRFPWIVRIRRALRPAADPLPMMRLTAAGCSRPRLSRRRRDRKAMIDR